MDFPRGLPDNPAQARRAIAAAALANPTPPPPVPSLRDVPSSQNLSAAQPVSPSQVLAVAREAMRAARENEARAAEASGLKPGLTINLSRKKIQTLPEEIVDVIKDELERLALSHNYLQTFPARFSECTSLRYLNVRQNRIKEFPLVLCDLKSLEILDLGRNMLQLLPPEIVKMSSLKVLSIPKNQITHLPLCLADMPSLYWIKLEGNPLKFPPPEVLQPQGTNGGQNDGVAKENETTEIDATAAIKKFLKQEASGAADSPGDGASEGTETPRPTIKRVFSGRFPIKVNGSEIFDLRSPAVPRPPPIPNRSHYRGLSQQNSAQRRPGVMPLTIGNPNERLRSNSETIIQTSSRERSESRSRRMGIVSKRSELSTLEEIDVNRFSHFRGLSHGSAMQGNGAAMQGKSSNLSSPAEPALQRPVYIRRLSVLPERRRESKIFDPVLEAAKGILYSIFQIHPMIQTLVGLTNDGSVRRSNLEIVFYNTNAHVEQLELEIQKHDQAADDGYGHRENENVQRACLTLINAYTHVCSLLMSNVDVFLDHGDPRYIRTLLTQLYNSIMELRVTCSQATPEVNQRAGPTYSRPDFGETLRPHSRENSVTPTADRRGRPRNATFVYNPSNLRVTTDVSVPYINGTGRNATVSAATPRSGESFVSTSTTGGRNLSADFTEEDRIFERIFLSLQKTTELVMRILPAMNTQFMSSMRAAAAQRSPDDLIQCWRALVVKCNTSIQQTEVLKARLSSIKLKEPGVRTQASFWRLCNTFVDSWYVLIQKFMHLQSDIQLPIDTKVRLRPIQQSMKETCDLMMTSPWAYFLRHPSSSSGGSGGGGGHDGPDRHHHHHHHHQHTATAITSPSATHLPLPMTPQSAALGPAVQATVPSTPQSASFAAAAAGNGSIFGERADSLLSINSGHGSGGGSHGGGYGGGGGFGMFMSSSRSGTMNSSSTASLTTSSLHSMSSTSDGVVTPSSALSPGPGGTPFGMTPHGSGPFGPPHGPLGLSLGVGSGGKVGGY